MDVPTDAAVIDEVTAAGVSKPRFALSALNQRRWQTFKAHKRGYWSLWIFLVLFVISLFAEFIANDKPIIARYKGETLFPILVDYPESKFGGFLALTDYRDPVILDEINVVMKLGYLDPEPVVAFLKQRNPRQHVVLTGRGATPAIIEAADLVSEIVAIKHPYRSGIKAQQGIEF